VSEINIQIKFHLVTT